VIRPCSRLTFPLGDGPIRVPTSAPQVRHHRNSRRRHFAPSSVSCLAIKEAEDRCFLLDYHPAAGSSAAVGDSCPVPCDPLRKSQPQFVSPVDELFKASPPMIFSADERDGAADRARSDLIIPYGVAFEEVVGCFIFGVPFSSRPLKMQCSVHLARFYRQPSVDVYEARSEPQFVVNFP